MKYSRNKIAALVIISLFYSPLAQAKIVDLLSQKVKSDSAAYSEESDQKVRRDFDLREIQKAFNWSGTDKNISEFKWHPNKISKVNLRVHMKTLIYLPDDEKVAAYQLGDDFSFKVSSFGEKFPYLLDIQPLYAGVDSNLNIIGESGRVYSFYLRSYAVKSKTLPDFTIYVKAPPIRDKSGFQFPEERSTTAEKEVSKKERLLVTLQKNNDYLKNISDPSQININYKIRGDKEIAPYAVYDDGKWTYFDFRGEFVSDRLPVIYKVVDKFDSVVNTRMENGFLIAESLSPDGWTLKNGRKTVCIRPKRSLFQIYSRKK
jgi:type IV secretory pathway VirB9-like protein